MYFLVHRMVYVVYLTYQICVEIIFMTGDFYGTIGV